MCVGVGVWVDKVARMSPNMPFEKEGGGEKKGGGVGAPFLPRLFFFFVLQTSSRGRASGDTPCPRTRCALLL